MAKKLIINVERCAGCKRCELACIEAHKEIDGLDGHTRIFVESFGGRPVPVVCRHCREPMCVASCMSGAMQKSSETGIVNNQGNEQKCVGCWMCIMSCPYGVITPSDNEAMVKNYGFAQAVKCDMCAHRDTPACVQACPNDVISVIEVDENIDGGLL